MAKMSIAQWIIVFAVVSAALLQTIDTSIVNVTLTQMMGNLGATLEDISWVVTGYAAANVVMIALSGWLSAKLGRKNYFTASIILFTVASVFCGTSTTVTQLIIFRVIQGIGGGGLMSTAQSILMQTFPREEAGTATAIFGMGVIIGPTIGPTLGGYITDHLSWHWVFFINIPVGILAAVLSFLYIEDHDETTKVGNMDWFALALLVSSIASLQIVLETGQRDDWFNSHFITTLTIIAVLSGIIFIWKQLTVEHPLLDLKLLKHYRFAVGSFFGFAQGFGLYASAFVVPVFCQNLLGYTAQQTGMLLLPGSVATAIAMPLVGRIMKSGKIRPVLLAAIGLSMFILFVLMLSGMTLSTGAGDFFLPLIIRGVGMGLLFVPMTTITLYDLKSIDMPQGAAFSNMLRQLGGSVGIAVMTTFITVRSVFHIRRLSDHVTMYSQATIERMNAFVKLFMSKGDSYSTAHTKAIAAIQGTVTKQGIVLTYNDVFLVVGAFFLLCLPLLLLFVTKKKRDVEKEHEIELHFAE
ncbi:MAG TPA: DHA2 family efflux MFS transporter permease subunit [Bacteroidia bacterium]|nr:DHA2 family efflux MFS transporter permease subunit [Bacteroidia bacterium]